MVKLEMTPLRTPSEKWPTIIEENNDVSHPVSKLI